MFSYEELKSIGIICLTIAAIIFVYLGVNKWNGLNLR